jgi:hypothetical protein
LYFLSSSSSACNHPFFVNDLTTTLSAQNY